MGERMNSAMHKKVEKGEAIDLSDAVSFKGHYYVVDNFIEDKDYCVLKTIQWIWSVGRRKSDGLILASTSADLYQNPDFECLWLR